jgi:hypothetical protein
MFVCWPTTRVFLFCRGCGFRIWPRIFSGTWRSGWQAIGNAGTQPDGGGKSQEEKASPQPAPSPGHGRNGADAYPSARRVKIEHASLKSGNHCPGCQKGKLYAWATPGVLIRVVGQAPLAATVYELEKLRCNLCGEVFTAAPPEGVGTEKYDAAAASMIALLKYGSGFPFHRLERLQGNLEIPLPASTQWEIVAETAEWIEPIYQELIHQAAQGEVLHNDHTTMTILALMGESRPRQPSAEEELPEKSERTGIFTSGDRVHTSGTEDCVVLYRAQACGRKSGDSVGATSAGVGASDPDVRRTVAQPPQRVSNRCRRLYRARETQVCRGDGEVSRGMLLCAGNIGRGVPARGLLPGPGDVAGGTSRLPPKS